MNRYHVIFAFRRNMYAELIKNNTSLRACKLYTSDTAICLACHEYLNDLNFTVSVDTDLCSVV